MGERDPRTSHRGNVEVISLRVAIVTYAMVLGASEEDAHEIMVEITRNDRELPVDDRAVREEVRRRIDESPRKVK